MRDLLYLTIVLFLLLFFLLQAVWALGNIAGDSPQCRNMVLQAGALPPLLEQLGDQQKVSMQRNATWTLSNFCRGKPPPDFSVVSPLACNSSGMQP
jgi:hypothetical protein